MKVLSDTTPGKAPSLRPKIACGNDKGQNFSDLMSKIVQQMGELQAAAKVPAANCAKQELSPKSENTSDESASDQAQSPQTPPNEAAISQAASAEQAPEQVRQIERVSTTQQSEQVEQENIADLEQFSTQSECTNSTDQGTPQQSNQQSEKVASDNVADTQFTDTAVKLTDSVAVEQIDSQALESHLEKADLATPIEQDVTSESAAGAKTESKAPNLVENSSSTIDLAVLETGVATQDVNTVTSTENLTNGTESNVTETNVDLKAEQPIAPSPKGTLDAVSTELQKVDRAAVAELGGEKLSTPSDLARELEQVASPEVLVQAQAFTPRAASVRIDPGSAFVARYIQQVLPPLENATEALKGAVLRDLLAAPKMALATPNVTAINGPTSANNNVSPFGASTPSPQARAAGEREKSPRAMPRAAEARTLEIVDKAIKEVARSRDGKTISVRLDPPSLGSLKLDVTLKDGTLHARITVEHAQVATLLRDRAFDLHTLLRRSGFNVERVTLTVSEGQRFEDLGGGDLAGSTAENKSSADSGLDDQAGSDTGPGKQRDFARGRTARNETLDHWIA